MIAGCSMACRAARSSCSARCWPRLLVAPWFANDYLLTILILIFYFAYVGQAWNIMMGFAGQLSLGHALYVGLGAYTTAALYVHFGISPWLGLPVAVAIAALAGAVIGYPRVPLRRRRRLFRDPHHRVRRIRAHRLRSFPLGRRLRRASSCRSPTTPRNDLWNLRGSPIMFYYVHAGAHASRRSSLCHWLLRSRIGYFWQAIREDEEAARALGIDTFRYKMIAVVISAGMTSIAGVFFAFYYNNLFPEQVFHISRSIELILGADHRRHRHAVRPDHRRLPAHRPGRGASSSC